MAGQHYGAEEKLDASLLGGDCEDALVGRHRPVDPSSCAFWFAVAIGALVKGRPVESVSGRGSCACVCAWVPSCSAIKKRPVSGARPVNTEIFTGRNLLRSAFEFTPT